MKIVLTSANEKNIILIWRDVQLKYILTIQPLKKNINNKNES